MAQIEAAEPHYQHVLERYPAQSHGFARPFWKGFSGIGERVTQAVATLNNAPRPGDGRARQLHTWPWQQSEYLPPG